MPKENERGDEWLTERETQREDEDEREAVRGE